MEVDFVDDELRRLELDASFDNGLPVGVVKALSKAHRSYPCGDRRTSLLRIEIMAFPEKLKGNRQHQHSVRLNDQFRLILEIVKDDTERRIRIVNIEDYH